MMLLLTSPSRLLIAIGSKLFSPGHFTARADHLEWATFWMLKSARCQRIARRTWTGMVNPGEPRATRFGAFCAASFDELPQLITYSRGKCRLWGHALNARNS